MINTDKILTYSFCEPFIDNLVRFIDENYLKKGGDLSRLAIIFGGKRPALFVKQKLAKALGRSFYAPRFFTIDEMMTYVVKQHEDFTAVQDLDNSYLVYRLTQELTPELLRGRETFAQFLPWAREILSFIDQLDLEMIQDSVLKNIESNAQIGYAVPEDINKLLQNIVVLRRACHKVFKDEKKYARGFQYYRAAQIINEVSFSEFDQILFCNFFYFNRCEEVVAKNLHQRKKAALIFQGDQRKWPILNRIAKLFQCSLLEGESPDQTKFNLHLYSAFDAHSQIGQVREILKTIKNTQETVVVLPNADHIIPLLSEITAITKDFNISMGYPLKRSSLYTLLELIFKTQLSRKGARYYTKDYLKVIRHPFIKNLKLTDDETVTRIIVHKIEEMLTGKENGDITGSLFIAMEEIEQSEDLYMFVMKTLDPSEIKISREDFQSIIRRLHTLVFIEWEGLRCFKDLARIIERFINELVEKSFMHKFPLNLNIAMKILSIKDAFGQASFNQEHFPLEELFRIFEGEVSREIVAFIGSPLKGLQILGLFETRSLNFKNVIILDVNEGALPRLNIYEPLIPREVMISLNLDRLELEEEIQRYQFMRLISSAQQVHLVYQESKDKEKSRFVEELIWEKQKQLGKIDAVAVTKPRFEVKITPQKLEIKKTPEMIDVLKRHKYSASSINTYLRDPVEFYYSYVLGLREQEGLLDEPEARHIGTFIHEVLQDGFQPFLNKKVEIDARFRKLFFELFEQKFIQTFGRSLHSDSFLLKSVLTERLTRFLDNEEKNPDRRVNQILYLESRFEETISLSCGDIRFGYIVDRVDEMHDGTIMIVDYKSGSTDVMPKPLSMIESMDFSRESIAEDIKSFQIPLYFHYLNQHFKDKSINAGLYNLRTLQLHKFLDYKMQPERARINQAFLRALDFILSEILNPEISFTNEESKAFV